MCDVFDCLVNFTNAKTFPDDNNNIPNVRRSVGAKIFGCTVCNECVQCSVFAVTEPTPGER